MSDVSPQEKSVAQKTREGMAWFTLLPSAFYFLSFANSIIVARILSPEDFGIMGIAAVLIYYCDSFTNFGIANAIIQRKEVVQHHINAFFTFNLILSIFLFFVFFVFSTSIADFFAMPGLSWAIRVYSLVFLLTALTAVPEMLLRKSLRFKELAIIDATRIFLAMVASLALALSGWGYWSLIVAALSSQLFQCAALMSVAKYRVAFGCDLSRLRELFQFGIWDFCWGQVKLIGDNIDKLIVGKLLGAVSLGFYDKAFGLSKMPNEQIANRIQLVAFSSFSANCGDSENLTNAFIKFYVLSISICTPLFFGLYTISDMFTIVLLGERWSPMIQSLEVLCFSFWFASVMGPVTALNMALGKVKVQAVLRLLSMVFLIPVVIVSAPSGIFYVAISILVFNIVVFFGSLFIALPFVKLSFFSMFKFSMPPVLGGAVMIFLVEMSKNIIPGYSFLGLVFSITIGASVYAIWFLVYPTKYWDDYQTLIIKKIGLW